MDIKSTANQIIKSANQDGVHAFESMDDYLADEIGTSNYRKLAEAVQRQINRVESLADALGYEEIKWDTDNDCYSGYGSSDPTDRSRDAAGGLFVAADDDELETIAKRELAE